METQDTSPHTALTDDLNYNEQISLLGSLFCVL